MRLSANGVCIKLLTSYKSWRQLFSLAKHRAKNMLANVQAMVHPIPATLALRPNPNFSLLSHGHVATTEFEKQISWG
jgi:hypothetical protein